MVKSKANFAMACAGMLLFGITLITLGSVLPHLKMKFALSDVHAGELFAILPFGILAGSLVFGYICDRFGYKILFVNSLLLITCGLLAIAHLPSPHWLRPAIFIFGFGGGCINGATNALVSDISTTHKGANLSLLGVFFAIGALGIPLILGLLQNRVSPETVLTFTAALGFIVLVVALFQRFPPGKPSGGISAHHVLQMLRSPLILLVAFFLFFQSSMEAVAHNWATTYMTEHLQIPENRALFALTANVIGMAVMRLIIGTVLRKTSDKTILWISVAMMCGASLILVFAENFGMVLMSLTVLGAGMAAGFPLIYGIVGDRFAEMSATAFSFILTVALVGNMIINYLVGIIARNYGIDRLPLVILCGSLAMAILCWPILQKTKMVNKQ